MKIALAENGAHNNQDVVTMGQAVQAGLGILSLQALEQELELKRGVRARG